MNKLTINKIILYSLSMAILFGIPIYTIIINGSSLKGGAEYLFKVKAFDPYDMFRGNYLNINFEEDKVKSIIITNENTGHIEYKTYYVTIEEDKDGFAYFNTISEKIPKNTSNYFKTTGHYSEFAKSYIIDTPTRYYMNEKKSLSAEETYRRNIDNTYVKVRVKNGKMVIVGVYVNDVLIDTID